MLEDDGGLAYHAFVWWGASVWIPFAGAGGAESGLKLFASCACCGRLAGDWVRCMVELVTILGYAEAVGHTHELGERTRCHFLHDLTAVDLQRHLLDAKNRGCLLIE